MTQRRPSSGQGGSISASLAKPLPLGRRLVRGKRSLHARGRRLNLQSDRYLFVLEAQVFGTPANAR